jgi:AAA15 family ATPase/GTPase
MKYISNLGVKRFRGITDLTLDDLGDINFIVGDNNVGKTSILEAVSLWTSPGKIDNIVSSARLRIGHPFPSRIRQFECFVSLFPFSHDNKEIHLTAIINDEQHDLIISGILEKRILPRTSLIQVSLDDEEAEEEMVEAEVECFAGSLTYNSLVKEIVICEDEIKATVLNDLLIPIKFISPVRHITGNTINKDMLPYKENVTALLSLFDENITGFDSVPDRFGRRPTEYIHHKKHGIIPVFTFGDGLKRVLVLASYIALAQNGILLIDEIDTSIHVSILSDIFKWFIAACKKFNVQVFASTHSKEALSEMVTVAIEDKQSDFVAYKIENARGRFYCKRYSEEKLDYVVNEMGQDIR